VMGDVWVWVEGFCQTHFFSRVWTCTA